MDKLGRINLLIFLVALSARPVAAAGGDTAASADEGHAVIVATQRDHRVHIFDAESLLPLGSIVVNNLANHVAATSGGQILFVAAAETKDGNDCCAVFALRLQEGTICPLLYPAQQSTMLPNGERVFLQRGNTGIDVFDARSLAHLPTIRAPGVYRLLPSPDGRWLFGITQFQGPSLDIISLRENRMVRRLPLPNALTWDGAWLGQQFFLFAHDGGQGQLWTVQPEETPKGPKFCKETGTCTSRPVALPDLDNDGKPVGMRVVDGSSSLFAYETLGWWFKIDRRSSAHKPFPGGIFKIDPISGKLLAHFAPDTDFAQVIVGSNRQFLYGLDAGRAPADKRVRLLKLDANTGQVLMSRLLQTDVWSITFATIPSGLIPQRELTPRLCPSQ